MSTRTELNPRAKLLELIEQQVCVYCGNADYTLVMTADGNVCCGTCRKSKGQNECNEWMRGIKVTDPVLWDKMVENNRLKSTPIANLIRKIRMEG